MQGGQLMWGLVGHFKDLSSEKDEKSLERR